METQVLTPHVYWAQRHRELYLRVELSDVQVKAGLRAARRIGGPPVPVGRPVRLRSCSAPAGTASGAPRSPLGAAGAVRRSALGPGIPFVPGRRPGEPQQSPGSRRLAFGLPKAL